MKLRTTPIDGVMVAETEGVSDQRGAFSRLFCEGELASVLGHRHIIQINHSRTSRVGAVRGMHYQNSPYAEMKMIRCLRGRVWDVAVDLRKGSPTFLHWHTQELTPDNALMMVIPEGCAHGFQAMEAESELLYLHTEPYTPGAEGGVLYNDPAIGIDWPLAITEFSERDQQHPPITKEFQGLVL